MVKTVDPSPPIPLGCGDYQSSSHNNSSNTAAGAGTAGNRDRSDSEDSYEADQRAAEANRRLVERHDKAQARFTRARQAYTKQDEEADNHCIQRSFDPVSKDFADPDAFCYWRDDVSDYKERIWDKFTWQGMLSTPDKRTGKIPHPIYGARASYDPVVVMSIITAPMQVEHRNLLLRDKAEYEGRTAVREEFEKARKQFQLLKQELFGKDTQPSTGQHEQIFPLLLRNGTIERRFQPTTMYDEDGNHSNLQSITGMFTYQHYSFEELRLQDFMQGNSGSAVRPSMATLAALTFGPASLDPMLLQQRHQSSGTRGIPFTATRRVDATSGTDFLHLQSITGMARYENRSFEELRLEDYYNYSHALSFASSTTTTNTPPRSLSSAYPWFDTTGSMSSSAGGPPNTTRIPSWTENGQSYYLETITGSDEYSTRSVEELRLEHMLGAAVIALGPSSAGSSTLESLFNSLAVAEDAMSDGDDDTDNVNLQCLVRPGNVSFEENRLHDMAERRRY